jgi:hypothetical protein
MDNEYDFFLLLDFASNESFSNLVEIGVSVSDL